MYEYSVWHDPRIIDWAISRWPPARVCYTCVMERDYEVNSVAIAPQMTIEHYQLAGVEGTFSIGTATIIDLGRISVSYYNSNYNLQK